MQVRYQAALHADKPHIIARPKRLFGLVALGALINFELIAAVNQRREAALGNQAFYSCRGSLRRSQQLSDFDELAAQQLHALAGAVAPVLQLVIEHAGTGVVG
jgi:hypothetical protein